MRSAQISPPQRPCTQAYPDVKVARRGKSPSPSQRPCAQAHRNAVVSGHAIVHTKRDLGLEMQARQGAHAKKLILTSKLQARRGVRYASARRNAAVSGHAITHTKRDLGLEMQARQGARAKKSFLTSKLQARREVRGKPEGVYKIVND